MKNSKEEKKGEKSEAEDKDNSRITNSLKTKLYLDKRFKIIKRDPDHLLTAPDKFSIVSKLNIDNKHKQLYAHAKITIFPLNEPREKRGSFVTINGVILEVLNKGMILQYLSSDKADANRIYHEKIRPILKLKLKYKVVRSVCIDVTEEEPEENSEDCIYENGIQDKKWEKKVAKKEQLEITAS